jgi:hypothetical protein
MDAKAEKIALFRYGLVAPLVLEPLPRGELLRRAREIAARQYEIPGSKRISLCPETLLKWARHYRQGGFEALGRKPRQEGTIPFDYSTAGRVDRAFETREPASRRHHPTT